MRKIILLLTIALMPAILRAQGGMWLPSLVGNQIEDMRQKGFRLTSSDIYNVNKACMKDAVVQFGGGCTGAIVSSQGLLLTNHHCGRSYIQSHSTLGSNYLRDGFWAASTSQELPCPGLSVKILHRMDQIPESMGDMGLEENREAAVEQFRNKYGDSYEYSVESFYAGNIYYIFAYQVFRDVRLVGAPPSSIGNFGGDTDNWMWPRHGGDFSVFRIYAGKDNKPAEYSAANRPYRPKSHLKISLNGAGEGDFCMVMGYPGTTEEYLPSCALAQKAEVEYPSRVFVRQNIMDIYSEAMSRDPQARISYASRYSGVENAKKKWQGAARGIRLSGLVAQKQEFEKDFISRLSTPALKSEYGSILDDYQRLYSPHGSEIVRTYAYFIDGIYPLMQFQLGRAMAGLLSISDPASAEEAIAKAANSAKSAMQGRDSICERRVMERMYQIYSDSCAQYMPSQYQEYYRAHGIEDAQGFARYFYDKSHAADYARLARFMDRYRQASAMEGEQRASALQALNSELTDDPAYFLYRNFMQMYFSKCYDALDSLDGRERIDRKYQKALLELYPERIQFPDANLTMRFSYGKVDGFYPRDGVRYRHFTTLEGVMEKENPDIYDYQVPDRLKELFRSKDYGRYADKADGRMHVCFASGCHTTGGNSGSPMINANGCMIGINFDRCWEGTMSDVQYNPDLCRNISVDIRYVLFLIEKLGGAKRLIDEMDIVE